MGYDLNEYDHLNKWFKNLQTLPKFEENQAGAVVLADIMRSVTDNSLF